MGYDDFKTAFDISNEGYQFKISRITGGRSLKLITPDGEEYQMDGDIGYLNSQAVTGDCSFINGLNKQRGYDIPDGAVWDIQYVEDKGWTLRNVGTGKYLKDATAAKYDEPTYFTLCTLKEDTQTAIKVIRKAGSKDGAIYDLNGRRMNEKNLRPGIYIRNNQKIIIR